MKKFCLNAVEILKSVTDKEFAIAFIGLRMDFHRKHGHKLIVSTLHGIDLFDNILSCLAGGDWVEEGEYGDNFRKLIKIGRKENT